MGLIENIRSYRGQFWYLNAMQMLERLAFWCALLQLPIYIAQKDADGGLHWEQTDKGVIFFWWALVQNLSPIFAGAFADRYGARRTLGISFILIIFGYAALATQREFLPFLLGALVLGLGSGIFKPALQGEIARSVEGDKASVGWGIYVMLINIAVFLGPPLSIFLKGISWESVFFGCALITSLNFLFLLMIAPGRTQLHTISPWKIFAKTFRELTKSELLPFVLLMSGFTIIYMQFYETLPNFIYDWVDSSSIAGSLGLPDFMTMTTPRGEMIAYEWLYNLNSGMIILGVVLVSWILSRFRILNIITFGILASAGGLMLAGSAIGGGFVLAGFIVYTLGEMMTNPRFNEFMGSMAPERDKSLYMSFLNIAWAIGLGGGSLLGGYLYKNLGEKSGFAMDYISQNFPDAAGVSHSNAMEKLIALENTDAAAATRMLWETYDPWTVWLPFLGLAAVSAAGIFIYSKVKLSDRTD
jgi:predicted MFS family arabinose efflux permease